MSAHVVRYCDAPLLALFLVTEAVKAMTISLFMTFVGRKTALHSNDPFIY